MHATVRRYQGSDLADKLASRRDEVVSLMGEVPGFSAYYLIRGADDTVSVTVCDDEAGTRRSSELAADWLRANMPDAASTPPQVSSGEVVVTTAR